MQKMMSIPIINEVRLPIFVNNFKLSHQYELNSLLKY